MVTSTRIIDYDLKCCMMGQKCKNDISGRSSFSKENFVPLADLSLPQPSWKIAASKILGF
jgi:hypothetical protein